MVGVMSKSTGSLNAVRRFAREQFELQHRYVMALHTDEPHPHVHRVVVLENAENHDRRVRGLAERDAIEGQVKNLGRHVRRAAPCMNS
jgi:hypothetical protein